MKIAMGISKRGSTILAGGEYLAGLIKGPNEALDGGTALVATLVLA
jgi:hypothetical protein